MLARGTASGMRAKQGRIENFNSLSETIGSRAAWESTALCGLASIFRAPSGMGGETVT